MDHPSRISRCAVGLGIGLVLAACAQPSAEKLRAERLEGARRSLAAIPDVEVLAYDTATGVITIRSRSGGGVSRIELDSPLPANPTASMSQRPATQSSATSPAAPASPPSAPAASQNESEDSQRDSTADASSGAAAPAGPLPTDAATVATTTAATMTAPQPDAAPLAPTVTRDRAGRVARIEGPGFSVERSGTATRDRTAAAAVAAAPANATGATARTRQLKPIVCADGERRSVESVEIIVPGAGIVAERGCTLQLSNVLVRAGGWGLVVNDGARVRIDSSLVEGQTGAVDIYPGAILSAWTTTFRGAFSRPAAAGEFVDRGGNFMDTAPAR
jgi:hypothetical protein